MEDIRLNYYPPITTGTAFPEHAGRCPASDKKETQDSFQALLMQTIQRNSEASFSKHAVKRAVAHEINLTPEDLARLNKGIRLANEKNLSDTLILVDDTAFVVNAKNNTVITTMRNGTEKGNIFTNIEGTVIV